MVQPPASNQEAEMTKSKPQEVSPAPEQDETITDPDQIVTVRQASNYYPDEYKLACLTHLMRDGCTAMPTRWSRITIVV
jgi:hypothetical protein